MLTGRKEKGGGEKDAVLLVKLVSISRQNTRR